MASGETPTQGQESRGELEARLLVASQWHRQAARGVAEADEVRRGIALELLRCGASERVVARLANVSGPAVHAWKAAADA